ncbi:unnamed protein product [Brassica oleracea var. botrytis]|uniref:Uncharacterized protein n=3 Tax=Brassica TaxID=3705 RepID=A0A0D3B583_BRAOL|nr:PREDICTED: probable DNA double-strand break repair Rad50 ATPase [Brassica oleracea var. oleracea]XP_013644456.1 probable DNA double-strand break repair Rad50 ATPase [Brassica napus]KAH0889563.1 hypothetical protein HID58_051992 [Brassica napus]CAF1700201.1 unnamed protein product [Brassica napus]
MARSNAGDGVGATGMAEAPLNNEMMFHRSMSTSSCLFTEDEDMTRTALSEFKAKESEIERRKMEIRERVQAQLDRVEEETRRLATIREELESLADPTRKEVLMIRKKIDSVYKELRPLSYSVQKKQREYKEAVDAFNEKNLEKIQLITKLMELAGESENLRLKKLEDLSKSI